MTVPRPQISVSGAFRRPPRPRLSRRTSGFLGGLAVFIGLVLLFDAVITVVWEDPFTAVFTQLEQKELSGRLDAAEKAPLPAATLELVRRAGSETERMALLGAHERTTAQAGDPLGRISIPKTGMKFVFLEGTGVETLKSGPGHYGGTALPGERGTVAIAGHRTTYLAPFRRLNHLKPGSPIVLTMSYGVFTYAVEKLKSVPPTQTTVLGPANYDRLVLTTCTPLGSDNKRLIAIARLKHATPRGAAIKLVPVPPRAPDWTVSGNAPPSG
jgi:sortase A